MVWSIIKCVKEGIFILFKNNFWGINGIFKIRLEMVKIFWVWKEFGENDGNNYKYNAILFFLEEE